MARHLKALRMCDPVETTPDDLMLLPLSTGADESAAEDEQTATGVKQTEAAAALEQAPAALVPPVSSTDLLREFFQFVGKALLSTMKFIWWAIRASLAYVKYHPAHAALNSAFLFVLSLLVLTGSEIHDQVILGQISNRTLDKIVEASRFTRDFSAVRATGNGINEFLDVGAPVWAQNESIRAVLFHARKAGLSIEDQAVLLAIVEIESGFNPMARAASSSACGLFQFIQATGETFGLKRSDCMNPWLNAQAGVQHYLENYKRRVHQKLDGLRGPERAFRNFELSYYLHHDGAYSKNPGPDVKLVVLSGTQFLFRALTILEAEAESMQQAPTFAQRFAGNLWSVVGQVKFIFDAVPSNAYAQTK